MCLALVYDVYTDFLDICGCVPPVAIFCVLLICVLLYSVHKLDKISSILLRSADEWFFLLLLFLHLFAFGDNYNDDSTVTSPSATS